ncbi:MAG: DUF1573 domain-containing protein [Runella slithyformis]|jgi:hypothetical protein|nr:MAG: DUF1573 domain-containing protein [Cytophagales bacterium]TAG35116.1 MAG: DUF1573 domain-containing protein [Cytophagia bacterium]TAG51008.1 MAG: DUF1573 domain-containing protein [Runella slithyformis]TAG60235.1 MAG: DUF1573 domain-containing protein [Runella slithyformis]TAG77028.1 MAG: DUF1573 domain-containing protein [Cytophagales bacterium]
MKKVLLFFVAILAFSAISYAQKAAISFQKSEFDFGKIQQGKPVTNVFKFTNTGKEPLILGNVSASCGCTTPTWTKEPIAPGGTGVVSATFNAGVMGAFNKSVTVQSNAENGTIYLTLKGEVIASPTPAATAVDKKSK